MFKFASIMFALLCVVNLNANGQAQLKNIVLPGIQNPQSINISYNGKKMLVVDHPKKSKKILYELSLDTVTKTWTNPVEIKAINKLLDDKSEINSPFYGYNLPRFYFSAILPGGKGGKDIYYSEFDGNEWGKPINLGDNINTIADEDFPSISGNERSLYFVRIDPLALKDNIYGGKIWQSNMNEKGEWAQPMILNNAINNSYQRTFGVFEDNVSFLYPMYDKKMGWNLYWTRNLSRFDWYFPISLTSVNTNDSEISPAVGRYDKNLYFLINKGNDKTPKNKLFCCQFPDSLLPEQTVWFNGSIIDRNTQQPVNMDVKIYNSLSQVLYNSVVSDKNNGHWKAIVQAKNSYTVEFIKKGYSYNSITINADKLRNDTLINTFLFSKAYLKLNAYDAEMLSPLKTDLKLRNKEGKYVQAKVEKAFDGQSVIEIPLGEKYYVIANSENFHPDSIEIDLSSLVVFDKFEKDIELKPIKKEFVIDVADSETNEPLLVEVIVRDKATNEEYVAEIKQNAEGKYVVQLRQGGDYEVNIRGPKGYSFYNEQVNLESENKSYQLKVELQQLKAKTKIQLKNILFEHNSADLQEISFEELQRVHSLLMDNPLIKIEISAHTDDKGSDLYNQKLSEKRASSVVGHLIKKGVPINRLLAKGYGESMPLVENTSEENRALNRRVELKVIDVE